MKRRENFLLFLAIFFLAGCGEYITSQDKAFIAKIKHHLKKKGDAAKVSNIFPGDWLKVCFNPIGAYGDIQSTGREVINRSSTYANDEIWGIYFLYPDNKAEYYKIPWDQIYPRSGSCVDKDSAFFYVMADFNRRKLVSPKANVSTDFIELTISNSLMEKWLPIVDTIRTDYMQDVLNLASILRDSLTRATSACSHG